MGKQTLFPTEQLHKYAPLITLPALAKFVLTPLLTTLDFLSTVLVYIKKMTNKTINILSLGKNVY